MEPGLLHALSIPVLMLIKKDLEFHRAELIDDGLSTVQIDGAISTVKSVLVEKTDN